MPSKGVKKARASNIPRLSAEDRLQSRFYEPLVLLHILDRNGERRISRCPSEDLAIPQLQLRELRRSFLDQLAYVCDYAKGGDTVTAIALESQPSGVTFWVASNTEPSAKMILFLRDILNTLQSLGSSRTENARTAIENEITRVCIDFNLRRIKGYFACIQRPLQQCVATLKGSGESKDIILMKWLEQFNAFKDNLPDLCHFAYQQRACQCMRELQEHIGDEPVGINKAESLESRRQAFLLTRHFIGRLGSHLKAAKILTAAGWRMADLFDNFTIRTRPAPKPPSLPPPTDHLTTLSGIIKRMLPANSGELQRYHEGLAIMDSKFNIQGRLQAQYQDKDFRPRVHAELALLEYFYMEQLPFVDDDRFIACSKPACYCCFHYISLHPGGFVRPASHGVRYLNWRPPDLVNATDILEKNHQRDVLNKVIAQIRLDALRQIEQRKGPSAWHPDSTTGISYSREYDASVQGIGSSRISEGLDSDIRSLVDSTDESSDSDGGVLL